MAVPGPTSLQVRAVDPVLTGLMSLHANAKAAFIADAAFPPTYRAGEHTGTYFRAHTDFGGHAVTDIHRAPGDGYRRGGFNLTNATYRCVEYGWETPIDRALAAGPQTPISLEELAATLSLHEVMIARERRVRDAAFITGQWTTEATLGAAAQWDDGGGAPLANHWTAIETVMTQTKSAKRPNAAIYGQASFRVLIQNQDFTTLIPQAQSTSMLSEDQLMQVLAGAFGLKKVFVGRAVESTAVAQADLGETLAFILPDNALIFYAPELDPEGGRQLGAFGQIASTDGGAPTVVDRYYEDDKRCDVARVREQRAEVVYDAGAGYLILDCAN